MDRRKKILVADDESVTRELLALLLTNAGYEVVFAKDGVDAVQKASTEKPDLVLMDGLMPKLHGFVACKAIKQLDSPPKVLLLTGVYTKLTYKWQVRDEYDADGLVSKPFDRVNLLAAIEILLSDVKCDEEPEARAVSADSILPRNTLPAQMEMGSVFALGTPIYGRKRVKK
jgi:two-component system alkaline phosphatase synthesis response regulator PhoP